MTTTTNPIEDVQDNFKYTATKAGTDFEAKMIPRISATARQKVVAENKAAKRNRSILLLESGLLDEAYLHAKTPSVDG